MTYRSEKWMDILFKYETVEIVIKGFFWVKII